VRRTAFGILRHRAPLPDTVTVDLEGKTVTVAVRSPPQARRYALRLPVKGDQPVLTIPRTGRLDEALDFLDRHRPWLAARLAARPQRLHFADGAIIPLRGRDHAICATGQARGGVRLVEGDPPVIEIAGQPEFVARRLTDFLKREAKADLLAATRRHAEALGVTFATVTVKDTVSRWGSCSAAGVIAYSWRIILAPPAVLDYLAAHEVAHLREMNHSIRFWRIVARLCPAWQEGRKWLKHHGHRLHLYGQT
jgi:predicted metal-dependent hydrolase